MDICRNIKRVIACVLMLALVCALAGAAFAEEPENGAAPEPSADASTMSIIDPDELQARVDGFIQEKGLNPDNISFGYCYTETGDRWYYNEDKWYYSASMYKVPLMMMLAEEEKKGVLTRDSDIFGLKLGVAEEFILVYSHNDYAHLMMKYFGTEPECRLLYKQYSDLPDDYYISDFSDYSYFTARFMTDVMETLYNEPERFPNIIDSLKLAQPENYFHKSLGQTYPIAQKYGSLNEFNHTTGIIYMPHPIILTVMTSYAYAPEDVIADAAKLFTDYTLELDEKLDRFEQEKAEAERAAAEEAARQAEEAERAAEEEARRQAEEEAARKAAEEQQRIEAQKRAKLTKVAVAAGIAVAVLGAAAVIISAAGKRKKRAAAARRRYEEAAGDYGRAYQAVPPARDYDRTYRSVPPAGDYDRAYQGARPSKPEGRRGGAYTPKH